MIKIMTAWWTFESFINQTETKEHKQQDIQTFSQLTLELSRESTLHIKALLCIGDTVI